MTENYCKEHETVWFKRGKMRGFAHPIVDENGNPILDEKGKERWCNKPEDDLSTPAGTQEAYQEAKKELNTMSKDDWEAKDQRTRKSIERQTAGNLGVKCVELSDVKEGITKKAITSAKDWEKYFETGD